MKIIRYKTAGEMLTQDRYGSFQKLTITGMVEKSYSEEALKEAETEAIPGTIEVIDALPPVANDVAHHVLHDQLALVDRATGKPYAIYVENGKLMMEAI